MIEISDVKGGRWGLSKIIKNGNEFKTYASDQRLADRVDNFYPPFDPVAFDYHIDCALICLKGTIQIPPDANTIIFPRNFNDVGDVALSELTQPQRDTLSSYLSSWLPAYSYQDRNNQTINVSAFSDLIAAYTGSTTLKEVARDIYRHFQHSKNRV